MSGLAPDTLAPRTADEPPPSTGNGSTEEEFCRSLPRHDPVAAQQLLCAAVARLLPDRARDERQLAALLVFDRYAHPIGRRLLVQYGEGDAQLRSLDRRFFIAAQRLSRTFSEAFEWFLATVGNRPTRPATTAPARRWSTISVTGRSSCCCGSFATRSATPNSGSN